LAHLAAFLQRARQQRDIRSFPTRRSSDLRESTWEVRPLGWDLKEQTGREIHGVRPGNLFIYAAFDVPIYKTKRFALDAITKIERSEEHTSELQSRENLVCRLLLEKKKLYG